MRWLHTVHHDGSEKHRSTLGDGGDRSGTVQPLDHLVRLGVSAICLNPVLAAYSSYRYDPIDYTHVDPHLGSDEALIALRRVGPGCARRDHGHDARGALHTQGTRLREEIR